MPTPSIALESFYFGGGQDDGATAIAEALSKTAPGLRELDLSGNELTAGGAAAVATCAGFKRNLEYLGLEENEIGSAGAKAVCHVECIYFWKIS